MNAKREVALSALHWLRVEPLRWMPRWMWNRVRHAIFEAIMCALDVYNHQRQISKPSNN